MEYLLASMFNKTFAFFDGLPVLYDAKIRVVAVVVWARYTKMVALVLFYLVGFFLGEKSLFYREGEIVRQPFFKLLFYLLFAAGISTVLSLADKKSIPNLFGFVKKFFLFFLI